MKRLLTLLLFFTQGILFAQLEIDQSSLYKQIIFNVHNQSDNSIGTAFIVGKSERHFFLATAKHVLNGKKDILLTSIDGVQRQANLFWEHDVYDFAILRTPRFSISFDKIPIIIDLAMNDEVAFISAKDLGKTLPTNRSGIVRNVSSESISVIMSSVDLGHSGSPLFAKNGIAGIIIRNGRFIECINIVLANEIITSLGITDFDVVLEYRNIARPILPQPGSLLNKVKERILIKELTSDGTCTNGLANLADRNLRTWWSCTGEVGDLNMINLELSGVSSVSKIKIFIAERNLTKLPTGRVFIYYNNEKITYSLTSLFESKESHSNGFWCTYAFKKSVLATKISFGFEYTGSKKETITYNEIEIEGISL